MTAAAWVDGGGTLRKVKEILNVEKYNVKDVYTVEL